MCLPLCIRIIIRVLVQSLGDSVLIKRKIAASHLFRDLLEVIMDIIYNHLLLIAGQDLIKDIFSRILGLDAPITTNKIKSFHLFIKGDFTSRSFSHSHSGVLLLLQEEHGTEDTINLKLKSLVQSIDLTLHSVSQLQNLIIFVDVADASVDHNGVGISVDDIKSNCSLGQVNCSLKSFTAHCSDKGSNWLRIEAGMRETQAPIH
mmetsp:Transcript_37797/g.55756  ORF Transcript_37797/g.55756 Transcript_37797/m.55756 type:complete len:204 (-) Transcript_37797:1408-2019(-)